MEDCVRIKINSMTKYVKGSEEEILKAVKDDDSLGRGK